MPIQAVPVRVRGTRAVIGVERASTGDWDGGDDADDADAEGLAGSRRVR
jgi:hypothetical protein